MRECNTILSAKNPDLNPIEHLRDKLDQRVRRRHILPSNAIQLRQALIQEWNNIPQAKINTLIRSMRQRCQAVLHDEGGQTRCQFENFFLHTFLFHVLYK